VVTLMDWLGHSDLATTQRYLKGMSAKTPAAKAAANRTFAGIGLQAISQIGAGRLINGHLQFKLR